jgi:hypothetical protein
MGLGLVGAALLAAVVYTGTRAARELTPEVRASRRRGRRLAVTDVRREHFGSDRGWRYWRWARALLVAWSLYLLLALAAWFAGGASR